ncbi:MAG: glycosyltransferase family 9 protein [Candidatus Aureabacteria bacterium]|nr:glycosyltransferase family 9 protein [Candidatus Auribacterota bacterium]
MRRGMQTYTSVLVLSLGGLGDFLTRWPLWQSLRKTFPHATLSYLGYPAHGALLFSAGLCDEILNFNGARWSRPDKNPKSSLDPERGFRTRTPEGQIPNPKYELVISILGTRGREWVEQLMGDWIEHLVEIEPFPEEGAGVSVSGYVMAQALSMGFTDPRAVQVNVPAQVRVWAEGFWHARGLTGKRVIAVHPGSGGQSKNWPNDRFVELAARLIITGTAVIIFEGEAEKDHPRSGDGPSWPEGVLLVSNYKLVNVAALLARCDWYIGNDSGISHLAALQGVPSTVIFGPTDPALWVPGRGNVTVARRPVPCAPCAGKQRDQCAERRCLTEIGVDEIFRTIALT